MRSFDEHSSEMETLTSKIDLIQYELSELKSEYSVVKKLLEISLSFLYSNNEGPRVAVNFRSKAQHALEVIESLESQDSSTKKIINDFLYNLRSTQHLWDQPEE